MNFVLRQHHQIALIAKSTRRKPDRPLAGLLRQIIHKLLLTLQHPNRRACRGHHQITDHDLFKPVFALRRQHPRAISKTRHTHQM
jgi:hypothetical protein